MTVRCGALVRNWHNPDPPRRQRSGRYRVISRPSRLQAPRPPRCLIGMLTAQCKIRPTRAFWPSPRSRLSCQRRDQVMSWLKRPRAAAQTAPWARRGKDRADPRHTAAPQAGPPPAPTPAPEPARDLRPSIRDMIEWSIDRAPTCGPDRRGPKR